MGGCSEHELRNQYRHLVAMGLSRWASFEEFLAAVNCLRLDDGDGVMNSPEMGIAVFSAVAAAAGHTGAYSACALQMGCDAIAAPLAEPKKAGRRKCKLGGLLSDQDRDAWLLKKRAKRKRDKLNKKRGRKWVD